MRQRSKSERKALKRGPTKARTCGIMIPSIVGTLPTPCGDRVKAAGRCPEHYADWRNARDGRRVEGTAKKGPDGRVVSSPLAIRAPKWVPFAERKGHRIAVPA